jgi:hypothetical protein
VNHPLGIPVGLPDGRRHALQAAGLALVAALALAWIVLLPPSPDLAAQVYRARLFSIGGFSLWDNNWYAGHYLLDYSLLFPPLAGTLGVRTVGAAAMSVSCLVFWRLAARHLTTRPWRATALFALGATGDLFIGRITFALGVAFGLGAVLSTTTGRHWLAALLSLACAAASPVAALFLALVAAADLLTYRRPARAAALGLPAVALTLLLAVLFPEGGLESFGLLSLLAAAGLSLVLLLLLPADRRLLRRGVALYVAALLVCFVVPSPMGSNIVRLGVLLEPAILIGTVSVDDARRALARAAGGLRWLRPTRGIHSRLGPPAQGGRVLSLAVAGLVLWQINGPIVQSMQAAGDPSSDPSYYAPVQRFLAAQRGPLRIEVPFTQSHWEAVFLGTSLSLARGWERQLDNKYDAVFYAPLLTPSAYRDWLTSTAVRFVALPDAPLDVSSRQEAALTRRGLPFLHPVFASAHWRVYAVAGTQPLASGPGRLAELDQDGFTLHAAGPGTFLVRLRYTPYWTVTDGTAAVSRTPEGWTQVRVGSPGTVRLETRFSLGA